MSMSFEDKATNRGVTIFTIGQDKIQPVLDQAFSKAKKNLDASGFRKRHMPRAVFNQEFGEEVLYKDALNAILPTVYEAAATGLNLDVVVRPKIDIQSMEEGREWALTVEVVTKPEVKPGDYRDPKVSVEATEEATDAKVDEKVERERNNSVGFIIKESAAELGDTVVTDFIDSVDSVEFDGGKDDNFSLELGSNQFISGFEDQLVGAEAGETVEVNVIFSENYRAEDLASKDAKFVTIVHKVRTKEVPAFDDGLAKDIDEEVEALDELKIKHRRELETTKEIVYDDAVEGAVLELAVTNAEIVELLERIVHDEVHRAMNKFMGSMQRQGISPGMYFQLTGTTEEDLHKQYEVDTDRHVEVDLVIEAIAKAEGFEASDEEIEERISDLASEHNTEIEQVHNLLSTSILEHDIAMKEAADVVTGAAKVK